LDFFEKVWRASYRRARQPVEGVLLDESAALALAEDIFDRLLARFRQKPAESEFTSEALELAAEESRLKVALDRREAGDPQRHHDPEDTRYPENLDLDRLQSHKGDHDFRDSEWTRLDPLLRPFGFHLLQRKGVKGHNAEDVYMETFAELARPKASNNQAPIEAIRVFEEIVPLFSRMIQFRAIDWRRKQTALKNQPNTQSSLDELTGKEEHAMQFEDPGAGPSLTVGEMSFDEIYSECEEALEPFEWQLVFTVYVSQSATMGELLENSEMLQKLGLKARDSTSKKRRILNEFLEQSLQKLARCLQN
jgi:hypothetical protein